MRVDFKGGVGCILAVYLIVIAFWIAVIWAAVHFLLKYW